MCASQNQRMAAVRPSADSVLEDLGMETSAVDEKLNLTAMERALAGALDLPRLTTFTHDEMLEWLAGRDPQLFFTASMARLNLVGGPPGFRKRSLRLLDSPAFLLELVRSEPFSTAKLTDFCARFVLEDSLLDVKLARLMPGRQSDSYHLERAVILRIMEVLDIISPGPRLLMIIGHLTHHPDKHVASKAALLVGRRLQSRAWVDRHLNSTDARVRANVVEAFWGVNSALAAHTLRKSLHDENNRVYGNAIVGLHLLRDKTLSWRIRRMAKDCRPAFRQTAAWVIGKVGEPEFTPLLEELLLDSSQAVRQSAETASDKVRIAVPAPMAQDFDRCIGFESVAECKTAENTVAGTALAGELKPTTTDNALAPADEPKRDVDLLPDQATDEPAFTFRFDGRYGTGG